MPSHSAHAADVPGLVSQHLPLVSYAVSEISSRLPDDVSRVDLVAAGLHGLTAAARAADPAVAFVAAAKREIRNAMAARLGGDATIGRDVDPVVAQRLADEVQAAALGVPELVSTAPVSLPPAAAAYRAAAAAAADARRARTADAVFERVALAGLGS